MSDQKQYSDGGEDMPDRKITVPVGKITHTEEISELLRRIASRAHAALARSDNLDFMAEAIDDIRADGDKANHLLFCAYQS